MGDALLAAHVPCRLVMFEGGRHGNQEFSHEQEQMEIDRFNRYVRDGAALPALTPRGN